MNIDRIPNRMPTAAQDEGSQVRQMVRENHETGVAGWQGAAPQVVGAHGLQQSSERMEALANGAQSARTLLRKRRTMLLAASTTGKIDSFEPVDAAAKKEFA